LKAASEGDKQSATLMKVAIEALAKTERNFVLKKGETTVGLEKDKLDHNEVVEIVQQVIGKSDLRKLTANRE
jgi:hypothetical protein